MGSLRAGAMLLGLALLLPAAGAAQSWRTVTMSRQASGSEPVRVQVSYGAGNLRVQPGDRGLLYRMHLRYDEDAFEPKADFRGNRLTLGLESVGGPGRVGRTRSGGEMDLLLGRGAPMDLTLEFGAVKADLDLGGLSLTGLKLSTGASQSTLDVSQPNPTTMGRAALEVGAADFTAHRLGNLNARQIQLDAGIGDLKLGFEGRWQQDAEVSIKMGLGSLRLTFPEGLGVRLTKSSFLTSLDTQGMVKRGEAYYSLDWERAERKVNVDLEAAFGSVKIAWVR